MGERVKTLVNGENMNRVKTLVNGDAMNFELRDQFDRRLAYRFPKERVSVLVFGDRKGSAQVEGWVAAIHERYGERIDLHGVAVLTSVPSLFRGFARSQFRKRIRFPLLMDFDGRVSEGYGYETDVANIFVIARDGTVVLKATGAATADGLKRVFDALDESLVKEPPAHFEDTET